MGRKSLNSTDNKAVAESNQKKPAVIISGGWDKPNLDVATEQTAINTAREAGFVKQATRTARLRGKKDERQGSSKNLQIRSFEKQEQVLDWIQQTHGLKSRKETFDALLAIALLWSEEGRSITDGMMQHFIAKDFTLSNDD